MRVFVFVALAFLANVGAISAQTLPVIPPPEPQNFRAEAVGSTITVSWDEVPGIGEVFFQYLMGMGSARGTYDIMVVLGSYTRYEITGVPPGTYYFQAATWGFGDNNVSLTPELEVVVGAPPPPPSCDRPAVPRGLRAIVVGRMVTLVWEASLGASYYELSAQLNGAPVYRGTVSGTSITAQAPPGAYLVSVGAQGLCGTSQGTATVPFVVR